MRTPDLTPAQLLALLTAAITLAASFGFTLDPGQRYAILGFVGTLLSVFVHSDAKIRHGRATGAAGSGSEVATPPTEPKP